MKKLILTGVVTLLPLIITLLLVDWAMGLLTKPFMGLLTPLLDQFELVHSANLIHRKNILFYTARLLVIFSLFFATVAVGFLTQWYVLRRLFSLSGWIIYNIPLVGNIYTSSKEVTARIFQQEESTFKEVVLVPFPHDKARYLAFTTNDLPLISGYVTIFVPGAPNPLMGFLFQYPAHQVVKTQIGVDEAIRFIVSCGALYPHPR